MWYTVSVKPNAQRFGYATMTPGAPLGSLAVEHASGDYTLTFVTRATIPAGGSVLLTLPPDISLDAVTAGTLDGFEAGATLTDDPAAVSDALAQGITRSALLIRLTREAALGPKTVRFHLATPPTVTTPLLVQTFDMREVLEYGTIDLK
jgi:hypothetical protein